MNIKKLERDELENQEIVIPETPVIKPIKKVGRPKKLVIDQPTKPVPPKVIRNVKIVSKNIV